MSTVKSSIAVSKGLIKQLFFYLPSKEKTSAKEVRGWGGNGFGKCWPRIAWNNNITNQFAYMSLCIAHRPSPYVPGQCILWVHCQRRHNRGPWIESEIVCAAPNSFSIQSMCSAYRILSITQLPSRNIPAGNPRRGVSILDASDDYSGFFSRGYVRRDHGRRSYRSDNESLLILSHIFWYS